MRGGDIAHVEWRVLPHQNNIDILAQVEPLRCALSHMVALNALKFDRMAFGIKPIVCIQRQALNVVFKYLISALLRAHHQSKGRIPVYVDGFDRVHLNGDA